MARKPRLMLAAGSCFGSALLGLGCGSSPEVTAPLSAPPPVLGQPGPGLQQLVTDLEARRANVVLVELSDASLFSVRPWVLDLNEERRRVWSFEYPNRANLEADAAKISADGFRIGMTSVSWIGSPHFYKNSRILVNYVGCNKDVMALLESSVGPQFAGGGVPPITGNPCGL
jgi:hypothetical protein